MSALAGRLTLRPGARLPAIESSRRPLAERLLRGTPAAQAPATLAGLYALCGEAHRYTAQLAVDAACGLRSLPAPHEIEALALETMREHVRRIWLDWPRLLGGNESDDGTVAALRECPLFKNGHPIQPTALRRWIEAAVLGEALPAWFGRWRADPCACLDRWSARGKTMPARLLRAVADEAGQLGHAGTPLLAHAQVGSLAAIASAIAATGNFEQLPTWNGNCCETGSWNRLSRPHRSAGHASSLWYRLGARVAELAALGLAGPAPLAMGAVRLAPGEALAWSEMARGLLMHRVRLEHAGTAPLIAQYRVVAPTEWNFHPHGVVATMLTQMPVARSIDQRAQQTRQIGILAAAFDPCIAYQIEFEHA